MIPLIAISNSISFFFCLIVFGKIYFCYQKGKGKEDKLLKYFLYFFSFLTLYFFLLFLPDFLFFLGLKDIILITALQINAKILLYLAAVFIVVIPFRMLNIPKAEKVVLMIMLISLSSTILSSFAWFKPSTLMVQGEFFHFTPWESSPWLRIKDGAIIGIASLFVAIFFFIEGWRSRVGLIKTKSFYLGFGILGLTLAAFVNYIGGAIPRFAILILASLLAISGMLLIYLGLVYRQKNNTKK